MNPWDFLVFGPASLWFLGFVVLFFAIVWLKNSNQFIAQMNKGTVATSQLKSELERISGSLKEDTNELTDATSNLNTELALTRNSTDRLHTTLQRFLWWRVDGDKQ